MGFKQKFINKMPFKITGFAGSLRGQGEKDSKLILHILPQSDPTNPVHTEFWPLSS